jgi:hypothetical protein
MLSELELSFICGASVFLFPLGPPVKVCTKPLWGPEGRVYCWPDPLWKPSEALFEIELLDVWPLDVGQSGCRCDTHGSSWKPPSSSDVLSLETSVSSLSLFHTSSEIQSGDRNLCFFEAPLMTADKRIFSPAKGGNAVKCPIISAALLALLFTHQLFISIYQTQMKVEHSNQASKFRHKLWKNCDLTGQLVITYIYLGVQ